MKQNPFYDKKGPYPLNEIIKDVPFLERGQMRDIKDKYHDYANLAKKTNRKMRYLFEICIVKKHRKHFLPKIGRLNHFFRVFWHRVYYLLKFFKFRIKKF